MQLLSHVYQEERAFLDFESDTSKFFSKIRKVATRLPSQFLAVVLSILEDDPKFRHILS